MRGTPISRYRLVPQATPEGPARTGGVRRRYSLARVGPSPRSALGEDRHERMERAGGLRGLRPGGA